MSTREFEVVYIGTVREVYYVEADSEEEARQIWADDEPLSSEVIEGGVESVREVGEDAAKLTKCSCCEELATSFFCDDCEASGCCMIDGAKCGKF